MPYFSMLRPAAILAISLCTIVESQQPNAGVIRFKGVGVDVATQSRFLIIQAEDLGMAHSIDKATFEALEKGWVNSAGVLVPAPWFPEVLRWSRSHPSADLGVQLDLNADWSSYRWRPLSGVQKQSGITDSGGYLSSSSAYVAQNANVADVETELRAQVDVAQRAGMPVIHSGKNALDFSIPSSVYSSFLSCVRNPSTSSR